MKRQIKTMIMFFMHPYISFKFLNSKGLYIGKCSDIRGVNQIKFGENVRIGSNVRINFFTKSAKLIFGNSVYICNRDSFLVGADIEIGDNTIFASDVLVCSENHRFDPESTLPYKDQPLSLAPVKIGKGCWIGEKSIILPGVKIGDQCVIGAGSIVTKSLPDNCMAVGNPAKIIKKYSMEKHTWYKI